MTSDYTIVPYLSVVGDEGAKTAIDRIFFSSSNTKSFASELARAEFRQRWLGRYLSDFADCAFVAADPQGGIVGYIVGSFEDPARDVRFADQDHFQAFAHLTPRYPAQLHVNLDEGWRGHGVGRELVDTFAVAARRAGAPGVHVVTSRGARNVRFYNANGFHDVGSLAVRAGVELVFLGRDLSSVSG